MGMDKQPKPGTRSWNGLPTAIPPSGRPILPSIVLPDIGGRDRIESGMPGRPRSGTQKAFHRVMCSGIGSRIVQDVSSPQTPGRLGEVGGRTVRFQWKANDDG
jgi:hypothetical protein